MPGPDRVLLKDWALLDLIAAAYSVRATQISGPNWLSDQCFDLEAKVPSDTPKEDLNAMLRTLLEERFGLKAHRAPKTGSAFALIVGKDGPKLKAAEPLPPPWQELTDEQRKTQLQQLVQQRKAIMQQGMEEYKRTGCMSAGGRSLSSTTISELASVLIPLVEAPVIDETGLTGKYSATLQLSKCTDGSETTIFDAVEKLGLKLVPRKSVTVETLVIDHVLKAPTAN